MPRSRHIDPRVLGLRIRAARQAAGLTQRQVAHPYTSTGYLSRIEAGQRRPSDLLLHQIANRVGIRVEDLLFESQLEPQVEHYLRISQAQWHLGRGELEEASTIASQIALESDALGLTDLAADARILQAEAALRAKDYERGAEILEDVLISNLHAGSSIRAHALLCSAAMALGDLKRAIEIANSGQSVVDELQVHDLPESLELALVRAQAFASWGERTQAQRICETALLSAAYPAQDTEQSLGQTFWRASLNEASRGIYSSAWNHARSAVALTQLQTFRDAVRALERLDEELRDSVLPPSSGRHEPL